MVITGHGHAFRAALDLKRYTEGGADHARHLPLLLVKAFEAVFKVRFRSWRR